MQATRCESRYCGKMAEQRYPIYDERIGRCIQIAVCCEKCARDEMHARHKEARIVHLVPTCDAYSQLRPG